MREKPPDKKGGIDHYDLGRQTQTWNTAKQVIKKSWKVL